MDLQVKDLKSQVKEILTKDISGVFKELKQVLSEMTATRDALLLLEARFLELRNAGYRLYRMAFLHYPLSERDFSIVVKY